MKKIILIVVLVLLAFGVYAKISSSSCDDASIKKRIDIILKNLSNSPEGKVAIKQIEHAAKQGLIPASKKDEVMKTTLEMAIRKKRGCDIPNSLVEKTTQNFSSNPNGKQCPAGSYTNAAKQTYIEAHQDPAYPQLEEQVYNEVSAQFVNQSGRDKFDAKWRDPEFRKRVLIAVFDISLREENNCANVALPVSDIMQEFMN